jgi:hypothetical protein
MVANKAAYFIRAQNVANIGLPHILHGFVNHYCRHFALQYNIQQHNHNTIIAALFCCSCCSCPIAMAISIAIAIAIGIAVAPLPLSLE